jgi:hypothetical protein
MLKVKVEDIFICGIKVSSTFAKNKLVDCVWEYRPYESYCRIAQMDSIRPLM